MKILFFLSTVLFLGGVAHAADSRQGGSTKYVRANGFQDAVFITIRGNELNAFEVRRSTSTSDSVAVAAVVHWNNDSAKIGGYGHANSMSVIETGDTNERDRYSRRRPVDFENSFEITSDPKDSRAPCRRFSGSTVDGVCTRVTVTIPSYAQYEVYEDTTQVQDRQGNEIRLVVYGLRRPLPPPLPNPAGGCEPVNSEDLAKLKQVLNDLWASDREKADTIDRFIYNNCSQNQFGFR